MRRLLHTPPHILRRAIHLISAAWLICIVGLLGACGGGDPEDQDPPACVVDGQPRPAEVCR